ncbi:DUF6438 domain-containing protein [Fulvivirga maritima]|uniref:DUF6438 domain-containing protein n=1 Tax=Fulvivirga maritima TaxID=2904247 RepID=UPI001F293AE9|nr:DUF6438 domain-containing protein [Fulvivirga maritima]UII27824.1 DUF6438 domain-containing protein [Fulvivirga maritima]
MKNLLLLLLITIISCKTTQKTEAQEDPIIKMEKTPCFGTCPEYSLEIFADNTAKLHAVQHLPLKGDYKAKISDSQLSALISAFEEGKFFEYEKEYTANISDMPTTYLTFNHKGKVKKVKDYHGAPESLKKLEKQVAALVDTLEWEEVEE